MTTARPPDDRPDVADLDLPELATLLERRGERPYRSRQIFQWIYRHGAESFEEMTDLARATRAALTRDLRLSTPRIVRRDESQDGTTKFLLALADGRQVESVMIPEGRRATLCLSTQIGCAMRCGFCLTGKMGLVRNLTGGEIAGQARVLVKTLSLEDQRFTIVLMGMGEPLHNYDQTMKAIRILGRSAGLAVSPRRITLSTVGVVPELDRLATDSPMPNLAISLHATTEAQRDTLVPVNRKYGLQDIVAACRRFPLKRRDRITFEYVLLRGVNDSRDDARRLARLLRGLRCKVNLIPLNPAAGIPYERPTDAVIDAFARQLATHHLTVSVRKSRGRDIRAACGQLIVEGPHQAPGQELAARIRADRPSDSRAS